MKKWDLDTCEDLAQEAFCIAWETHKRKDIDPGNCTLKWMLSKSLSRVFGKYKISGLQQYNEYDPLLPVLSTEAMEEWFALNWVNLSIANNGNGKRRARYSINANGATIEMDSNELCSLLKAKEVTYDRIALSNFQRRGAVFYLVDGHLQRSSHKIKGALKISLSIKGRIH